MLIISSLNNITGIAIIPVKEITPIKIGTIESLHTMSNILVKLRKDTYSTNNKIILVISKLLLEK